MKENPDSDVSTKLLKVLPSKSTWVRAGVSAIPYVGGSLDHLLFNKADEVRQANITETLDALSLRLESIEEENIDLEWFETEEAIQVFRLLSEKAQFEANQSKRKILGEVVANLGSKKLSSDPHKLSVLHQLSQLSYTQIRLLQIVENLPPGQRQFGHQIKQTVTAIWVDDIFAYLKSGKTDQFWEGSMDLDLELELMESLNILRRVVTVIKGETGYDLSSTGLAVLRYLQK